MNNRPHALLSASSSHRWLECPKSATLEQTVERKTSSFAEEGTLAHEIAELKLRLLKREVTPQQFKKEHKRLKGSKLYNPEMEDHTDTYVAYVFQSCCTTSNSSEVLETIKEVGLSDSSLESAPAYLYIEVKVDLGQIIPEGFGTSDAVVLNPFDKAIEIVDLKYGKGERVDAENNSQLMLYALGVFYAFEPFFDLEKVKITIVQPRLDNISTWSISVKDLIDWAENVVRPQAKKAILGEGELKTGKHCRWCGVKPVCKAWAKQAEEIAAANFEFVNPDLIDEAKILELYKILPTFKAWVSEVENYVLQKALEGKQWEGFKLVEGRANRKYTDESSVIELLLKEGYSREQVVKETLKGIGEMEKLLSKKDFVRLLESSNLVVKPKGATVLVELSDKRPEIQPNMCESSQAKDFDFDYIE